MGFIKNIKESKILKRYEELTQSFRERIQVCIDDVKRFRSLNEYVEGSRCPYLNMGTPYSIPASRAERDKKKEGLVLELPQLMEGVSKLTAEIKNNFSGIYRRSENNLARISLIKDGLHRTYVDIDTVLRTPEIRNAVAEKIQNSSIAAEFGIKGE